MHIYNVSTKVEFSIEDAWKEWMLNIHIPAVMETGCFTKFQFAKLLDDQDTDGAVYAISYYVDELESFETYLNKIADDLRKETV